MSKTAKAAFLLLTAAVGYLYIVVAFLRQDVDYISTDLDDLAIELETEVEINE